MSENLQNTNYKGAIIDSNLAFALKKTPVGEAETDSAPVFDAVENTSRGRKRSAAAAGKKPVGSGCA